MFDVHVRVHIKVDLSSHWNTTALVRVINSNRGDNNGIKKVAGWHVVPNYISSLHVVLSLVYPYQLFYVCISICLYICVCVQYIIR